MREKKPKMQGRPSSVTLSIPFAKGYAVRDGGVERVSAMMNDSRPQTRARRSRGSTRSVRTIRVRVTQRTHWPYPLGRAIRIPAGEESCLCCLTMARSEVQPTVNC